MLQKSAAGKAFGSAAKQRTCSRCISRGLAVRIQCNFTPQTQQHTAEPDRRSLLLGLPAAATCLLAAGPAAAENGFVTWWKSRRSANGGAKLLNPLYVAQRR